MLKFFKENKGMVITFVLLYATTFGFMAASAIMLSNRIYGCIPSLPM